MEYATRRARATWADVMLSSPCRAQSYPGTVSHPIFSCFDKVENCFQPAPSLKQILVYEATLVNAARSAPSLS